MGSTRIQRASRACQHRSSSEVKNARVMSRKVHRQLYPVSFFSRPSIDELTRTLIWERNREAVGNCHRKWWSNRKWFRYGLCEDLGDGRR
jgi:hypothetical protein